MHIVYFKAHLNLGFSYLTCESCPLSGIALSKAFRNNALLDHPVALISTPFDRAFRPPVRALQGFVYLCFCHIPFHSEQSMSPGRDRSNCHAAWRGSPFAHACSAFAAESSAPCEHILSFVLWVSIFSMKSWHCAG